MRKHEIILYSAITMYGPLTDYCCESIIKIVTGWGRARCKSVLRLLVSEKIPDRYFRSTDKGIDIISGTAQVRGTEHLIYIEYFAYLERELKYERK